MTTIRTMPRRSWSTRALATSLSSQSTGPQEALAFATDGRGYYLTPEGRNEDISFVAQRQACAEYDNPESRQNVVSPFIEEVSGIALSARNANVLWAINDSEKGTSRTILTSLSTELFVDPIAGDLYIISRKRQSNTETNVYRAIEQPRLSTPTRRLRSRRCSAKTITPT
tara:strand:+ start:70707 stop:71216 length:510 start_codon:yes stop_codon:yes gene_type:complete